MIFAFINNLTLAILAIASAVTAIFVIGGSIALAWAFLDDLRTTGSPLKAWTVGISILVVFLAGAKTWFSL